METQSIKTQAEKLLHLEYTYSESICSLVQKNEKNVINNSEYTESYLEVKRGDRELSKGNKVGRVCMLNYFDPETGENKKMLVKKIKNQN
jgi:hypothetical protein